MYHAGFCGKRCIENRYWKNVGTFIKIPHLSEIKLSQPKCLSETVVFSENTTKLRTEEHQDFSQDNNKDCGNLVTIHTALDYTTKKMQHQPLQL